MGRITLKQAAAWCGGFVDEKYENITFLGAGNDTRVLKPGQLFVVLQGARDGHDFIPAAMEKGAAAVLCSRNVGDYPSIIVEDPRIALGKIAAEEVKRIGMKVVGVTGSVGKSTTKEMIAAVLETTYVTAKTPANHNNDIGMPMAVLGMSEQTQVAVLEMGMNHFREIAYLSGIAHPDYAVIINVGTSHIEYLGSREGIRKAKLEILEGMPEEGILFINGDDDMLCRLPEEPVQKVIRFGADSACQVRAQDVQQSEVLSYCAMAEDTAFSVTLPLEGAHYVSDSLAAVSVGLAMGIPTERIAAALSDFQNLAGRQEIYSQQGFTIIKDCYNAGPESMAAALAVLGNRKGRRVAVLGDMLELGASAPGEHTRVGVLAAKNADILLAFGPNACYVVQGAESERMEESCMQAFADRQAAISWLKQMAQPGDVLLFKGSRGMHMEWILEGFLSKNTEDNIK